MTDKYRSVLENWDERATVRRSPRRIIRGDEPERGLYFPEELEPVCLHPDITGFGEEARREILIRRLYLYIDFTVSLEQLAVNPALLSIAHSDLGLEVASEMRFDAHKIYCDEAYHALFSADLKRQVEQATGVAPRPYPKARFLAHLERTLSNVPPDLVELAKLCFAVVSETLISKTLSEIPDDQRLVLAVREAVKDHAKDERIHHAYFAKFLEVMWPQLTIREHEILGLLFPGFIRVFLEPDFNCLMHVLPQEVFDRTSRQSIVRDCYPLAKVAQNIAESARATVRLLDKVGLLTNCHVQEAFATADLLLL